MKQRNFTAGAQCELDHAAAADLQQIPGTKPAKPHSDLTCFAARNPRTGEELYVATPKGLLKATGIDWAGRIVQGSQFSTETAQELSAELAFEGSQFSLLMPRFCTPKITMLMTADEARALNYWTLGTSKGIFYALPADITWRVAAMLERMMGTGELRGCTPLVTKLAHFNSAMGRAAFALALDKMTGANLTGAAFPDRGQLPPARRQEIDSIMERQALLLDYAAAKAIQLGGPEGRQVANLRLFMKQTHSFDMTLWEAKSAIRAHGITQPSLF